jgi:hypothetical protein
MRGVKGCLHEEEAAQIPETGGSAELPRYCGEAAIDIIAVHGLASKYERTWSVQPTTSHKSVPLSPGRRYSAIKFYHACPPVPDVTLKSGNFL